MTNEQFEELAAQFYRETGMMAPGKDQSAAMSGGWPSPTERADRYIIWLEVRAARTERTREIVSMLEEGLSILTGSGALSGMGEAGFRCAIKSIKEEYPDAFTAPDGGE